MIDAGLLHEVYNIYNVNSDYTRGLRQAIGVREFEDFLRMYLSTGRNDKTTDTGDDKTTDTGDDKTTDTGDASLNPLSGNMDDKNLKEHMKAILNSSSNDQLKMLLESAIDRVKLNTRRLVRCQKRRLNRLQTLYGWNIHYVDSTEAISHKSDESWAAEVVGRAVNVIATFLNGDQRLMPKLEVPESTQMKSNQRDLWTQYICKACGDRVLRGAHEWEQHIQCRRHRKRISQLRKSQGFGLAFQHQPENSCSS